MKKTVIIYDNMLFASPGHLMKYFRKYGLHLDLDVKYLTSCVFKRLTNVKGVKLAYRTYDISDEMPKIIFSRIKSLTRSGEGYIIGATTPLDYFETSIRPLIKEVDDPVQKAIDKAIAQGIGTRKDFEELLRSHKEGKI